MLAHKKTVIAALLSKQGEREFSQIYAEFFDFPNKF
jgi:hypothetical protein